MFGRTKRQRDEQEQKNRDMFMNMTPGQHLDLAEAVISPFAIRASHHILNSGTGLITGMDLGLSVGESSSRDQASNAIASVGATMSGMASYKTGYALSSAIGERIAGSFGLAATGPIGMGISFAGIVAGTALGVTLDPIVRGGIQRTTKGLFDWGRGHVRFGGFHDSQPAYSMRQRSLQELNGSLLNARQYFGKEAQLFHS
jgi:hypothetical protein